GGLQRRRLEAGIGQAEIDDEQLDQERRAAEELDVGDGGEAQPAPARQPQQRDDEAEDEREDQRAGGDLHGRRPTPEQGLQKVAAFGLEHREEAHDLGTISYGGFTMRLAVAGL